ncbi:hypothetical protein pEaSNUABM30_00017 [Erwinia phage pEa_SNUABM_30]|uniref:Carboxy-S-adenosyl-L-methionine synthase n=1 Tax=Erwinia phage pEa_SNUABM_30 TaxID=2869553 RepID=A0AAE8XPR6_9CAUD|nr:tRNA methyltransferase [Erwinia phage pEa_SNUABM_30]UAW53135.1 hypothetical protein pEaSNUABM30_00017 [Erwinia phage pEa_SNUABM_30]
MSNVDTTMPEGKWEFNEPVAAVFDNMLQNSIPSYDRMRDLTYRLGRQFVTPGTAIVDLGASLGRAIEPFCKEFGPYNYHHCPHSDDADSETGNHYSLYEIAPAMRERLMTNDVLVAAGAKLERDSLTDVDTFRFDGQVECSLILSVLTLQFTPIEHRQHILEKVYDSLEKGGAFILVEKVLGDDNFLDRLLVSTYYQMKGDNGYSQESIATKRKSLEGVLVPVKASWNEELLRKAGFDRVECFYRDLNFAGWIAIK